MDFEAEIMRLKSTVFTLTAVVDELQIQNSALISIASNLLAAKIGNVHCDEVERAMEDAPNRFKRDPGERRSDMNDTLKLLGLLRRVQ